jgi:ABC-2 type transport system permease protein
MLAIAARRGLETPIGAYLRLELRRQLRNRRFVILSMALPVILYVLYTAVLKTPDLGGPGAIPWAVFFLASMAAYGTIASSMTQANAIAAERATGWTRQLRAIPLPSAGYVATKLLSAICLTVPALVLVSLAGILVNHVELPIRIWIELVIALALGSLPFAALAILLGYLLDTDSTQGTVTLSFFGLAILGGLFAPVESFPSALATLARVLPSYHLAELGRQVVADQVPDVTHVLVLAGYAVIFGGAAIWRYRVVERRAGA